MAGITNQYAASDGDIFSEFFKVYKLGPLIGERTWGGVRGIRGEIPSHGWRLHHASRIRRSTACDSKWVVENHGVAPDIEVDDRPDDVVRGKDAQLDRAIEEVMKQDRSQPEEAAAAAPGSSGISG